jgi:hydroxymethylbilane synthase
MTVTRTLRVGTRRSALARAQTDLVVAGLALPVEVVPITTRGDRSSALLDVIGGTGVFVSALREALLSGEIDVAVHSAKDLPVAPAEGIALGAVPGRDDPRDALVARDGCTLAQLPPGARIGTGSPRRAAQLRAARSDVTVVPVRGNVDTRVARVGRELDAVVLAVAGLRRLGRSEVITELLDPATFVPAPAQGALAVECRASDAPTLAALAALDDPHARAATTAERSLLAALEAGCSAPIGALATVCAEQLVLHAVVTASDGSRAVRGSLTGEITDPDGLGRHLAGQLITAGAEKMMGSSS